jgi:hypothetical protein
MMKILTAIVTLIPVFCDAQAPKGTNTIVITNITGEQAVQIFRDHGYTVSSSGYGIINTIPQKSPANIMIAFALEIKDSTGFLRGTYGGKEIVPELFEHSESASGHYKGGSFKIMDSLARSFGQHIFYIGVGSVSPEKRKQ